MIKTRHFWIAKSSERSIDEIINNCIEANSFIEVIDIKYSSSFGISTYNGYHGTTETSNEVYFSALVIYKEIEPLKS